MKPGFRKRRERNLPTHITPSGWGWIDRLNEIHHGPIVEYIYANEHLIDDSVDPQLVEMMAWERYEEVLTFSLMRMGFCYVMKPCREGADWFIEIGPENTVHDCLQAINRSLVWNVEEHRIDIEHSKKYWDDQLATYNRFRYLDTDLDYVQGFFRRVRALDHPDLMYVVTEAVMLRLRLEKRPVYHPTKPP